MYLVGLGRRLLAARDPEQAVTQHAGFPGTQVKLAAVSRGPENKEWAAATPIGNLEMTIANESAAKWFVDRLGQDVMLSFAPSEDEDKHTNAYSAA